MSGRAGRVVPWWALLGGATLLLLAYNSPWFRLAFPDLFQVKRWVLSLTREMNFAVWFSSILYLLSSALFFESAGREAGRRRWAYLQLSLLMVALVVDEVGGLHERISAWGGWWALAPFGLAMLALLADSLRRLWRDAETRPVAWLALVGCTLFGSVVAQEFFEHNLTSRTWSEWWGRFFEEASELVGALAVLGAAVWARRGRWSGPLADALPDPSRMPGLTVLLLGGFLLHLAAAQSLWVIVTGPPRLHGNPAALYPVIVFFLLACYAFWQPAHRSRETGDAAEVRGFWVAVALFFLACSIGNMQNLWGFVGKLVPGLGMKWFYEPVPIHLLMIAVVAFIALALRRQRGLRLLWLLGLVVVPWIDLELAHPAANYLASGLFALLCALALLERGRMAGPPMQVPRHRPT